MERPGPHTWGTRPSDFLTVRERVDVHNISQDSGLSHSPIHQELPQLTIGKPIGHIDLPPQPRSGRKEKKWNIGGIFRRRSKEIKSSDLPRSPVVQSTPSQPALPERNSSFRQDERPPPLPPKTSNVFQPSLAVRGGSHQIFPHLRADLQYPEPSSQPASTGYYYDQRFGYVRSGSYYDQQILMMKGDVGAGGHGGGGGGVSWRDQKQSILRSAEKRRSLLEESSESEEEVSPGMRRAGSAGSLNRRSRGARTERYLNRRPGQPTQPAQSPYVHTASNPPPPPPRDMKQQRPHLVSGMRARPLSYSFEHLRVPSSLDNLKSPLRQQNSHPLPQPPPRRPHSNQFSSSDLLLGITRESAVASPASVQSQPPSLENYVDPSPRSRRPILYQAAGSAASSEGIGGSHTSLEDSHYYLGSVGSVRHVSLTSPEDTQEKYKHYNGKHMTMEPSSQTSRGKSQATNNTEMSGISSPNSISSKDSGCSGSYDIQSSIPKTNTASSPALTSVRENAVSYSSGGSDAAVVKEFASSDEQNTTAGFSTQKRRSRFEEAIKELEIAYNNIANDEDLLDRAERRDLPTAHQLLIWRERDSDVSHNTSAESALSDIDNFINWNTSSSFEHLPARARTPGRRRSGLSDKTLDDMAARRISAANKVPSTLVNISELTNQSYLAMTTALSTSCADTLEDAHDQADSDEPDIRIDDVLFRNIRDANKIKIVEPQPKFGIPLGPVTGGANSDYLHAVPDGKYRSTFNSMRNPDLVKDDLAFRHLRKDENQCDPSHLGIVKDPHGLIVSSTNWPPKKETQPAGAPFIFYPNKHNPIMRSLSENIAQIVRKQSSRPGARLDDIITYEDLSSPVVYDSIKYTMDLINKEKMIVSTRASQEPHLYGGANTVYDLLRRHSEPDSLNTVGLEASSLEAGTEGTVRSCQDVAKDQDSQCEPEQSSSSQVRIGHTDH